ncbi:MFS transporter [Lacisediminihabitans changchengi]|uniref:MFS transporter n=1 Tax=Lacisediminihabitans changchengi TaxID=2787634 RepID=A0A934SJP9_9MICO|nr:MFS transporter [Lacisediminihabitans changchengi]MBK4346555.1 MFS transporter [Lacisediminihabitans changchengi]
MLQRHQKLVLAIAILASFVSFLDGSVVQVALPAIQRELGGGLSTQQWVVDAYLITLGSLILLAGSLSDVYGRIVILRVGLIGFGVASIVCFAAVSPEMLIAARAVQGIAGALLVPSSLAIILSNFTGAAQAKAIGQWTAFTSVAFIAGPLLGGIFVDTISWRYIFAINVVPIATALVLLAVLKQKDVRDHGVKIDYPGAVLGVIGLGLPVFALIEQGNLGWGNPLIWGSMTLGLLAFAGFIVRERFARQPMMPLGLFRVRNFAMGNIATAAIYAALSLGGFVLTIFLQQVGQYSALFAGLAFLPVTIISTLLSSYVGALAGRLGPRLFMTVGPIIGGLGYLYFLFSDTRPNYWTEILPGVILFGLGLTITVAPLTSAILGSISSAQSGIGSAINNAVARVAGLIATALVGIIAGSQIGLGGFDRAMIVTGALLIIGGIISFIGIRNLPALTASTDAAAPASPAAPAPSAGPGAVPAPPAGGPAS